MRIEFDYTCGFYGKNSFDIAVLPIVDVFKAKQTFCITFGWLVWSISFWFGKKIEYQHSNIK